jgi:uncharacterized protein YciI
MRHALVAVLLAACAAAPARPPAKPFAMRTYYMAILRRGPSWTAERTPRVEELGRGHMANIRRLGALGKLLIAGPFEVASDAPRDAMVGIFLFDVDSEAEAQALVATDPTIQAGHFQADVLKWYGPAGLTFDGREEPAAKARPEQK